MFRKGIVTFFDAGLGKGVIVLNSDQQQIGFQLEDFSNVALLPQVGERVKCVVLEQHGELLAKFIVRLDYKNYTDDQKKRTAVVHSYDENTLEHSRNIRKISKKRRNHVENEESDEFRQDSIQENNQVDLILAEEMKQKTVVETQLKPIEDTHDDLAFDQNCVEYTLKEKIEPIIENNQKSVPYDETQSIENQQAQEQQNINLKEAVIENIHNTEPVQELTETVIANVSKNSYIEESNIENKLDTADNLAQKQEQSNRLAAEPVENIESMHVAIATDHLTGESVDLEIIEKKNAEFDKIQQSKTELILTEHVDHRQQNEYLSSRIDQKMLEKSMSLNSFQRLIHAIKVKFFYSKRKQVSPVKQIKKEGKHFYLNPWIVIVGIILVLFVGGGKYAFERYKQYKSDSEEKLREYEKQQKDVIKKQKQQAHAR